MSNYNIIEIEKAYRLVNHGPVVMVSTSDSEGNYNIAPVAWNCPVRKSPSRILLGIGTSHKTYHNLSEKKEFIICVPNYSAADFVRYCGSVSGDKENKFDKYPAGTEKGEKVDALIPAGFTGYMECGLHREIKLGSLSLVIGEVLKAGASLRAFKERVRPEDKDGRTLHHLGGGDFGIITEVLRSKEK